MKTLRKLLSILIVIALVTLILAIPVYASEGGYIVRTTVETVTTTNGVVTGYDVQTYDSPIQYGTVPTASSCSSGSNNNKWVPNWGPNYANEQTKYMNSGKNSSSSCWVPNYGYNQSKPVVSDPYNYTTLGDEARARASEIRSYASDHGWSVDVSGDWGDCSYRNIEITVSNRDHQRTWLQKTVVNCNGCYETFYERDGHREYRDDVKYYIKDRQIK